MIDKQLQVEIVEASSLERSPGEPLRLTLQVRDETGEPAPAVLGVSVVDDAALSLEANGATSVTDALPADQRSAEAGRLGTCEFLLE